jgi:hypothetical protein
MEDLFKEHFGAFLATIITGFGGWFFGRKKANVDVEGVQIENFDKGLLYYQKLVDDLGVRLERSILALQKSEVEKQVVIQKFTEATKNIHDLEIKVEKLTEELQKYKQLNGKI